MVKIVLAPLSLPGQGTHSILSLPFCGIFVFKIVVGIPKSLNLHGERAETLVTSGHHTGVRAFSSRRDVLRHSRIGSRELPASAGDVGLILGREDPLEKEVEAYSSILVWTMPWAETPGELRSTGHRVGHDRVLIRRCRVLFANLG